MSNILDVFLYPISWLNLLNIRFRRKMFDLGRWKSVAFETPTVSIIHESNNLDLTVLDWVSSLFNEFDQKVCPFVHMIDFGYDRKTIKPYQNCNYLMQIDNDTLNNNCFDTKYSKILGMSEAYAQFENLNAFLIYESKYYTEIRNDITVLVLDASNDPLNNRLSPLGTRKHDLSNMYQADFIIIRGSQFVNKKGWLEFLRRFNSNCIVTLINLNIQTNIEVSEVAEYLSEQIDIIKDHHTFGRLLIQKVEEVNRKKQGDIEN